MSRQAVLWLADCTMEGPWLAQVQDLLGDSERQRHGAMRNLLRSRQFLMGRWLLRCLLSSRYSYPLSHWQVQERAQQAPVLLNVPEPSLRFSIAHSRQYVACLMADALSVGCDIEWMGKARNIDEIAALYFDTENRNKLLALPDSARQHYFYQMWTVHEAAYKAGASSSECQSAIWQDYCIAICLEPALPLQVQWVDFSEQGTARQAVDLVWIK